jgi:hypothetical protein
MQHAQPPSRLSCSHAVEAWQPGGARVTGQPMHRNTITLVWLAGIGVAALAYAVDPGRLLETALDLLATGLANLGRLVQDLSLFGSDLVRAMAIGLFVTFVALAIIAIRQGRKGRAALLAVSTVFVLLVRDGSAAPNGHWVAAFALAAIAALVMTGRVRRGMP